MTEIRSYRRVFDLERRVYSIDRIRLNPAGVPVRGIVYLLASVAVALMTSALPVVRSLDGLVPWYLRDIGVPAALAAFLALLRIDGRSFHTAAVAVAGRLLRPRRLSALVRGSQTGAVWRPSPIVMLPDGSDPRFRRLRYSGPGAVHVRRGHRRRGVHEQARTGHGPRRVSLKLTADAQAPEPGGTVIVLAPGARVDVVAERRGS